MRRYLPLLIIVLATIFFTGCSKPRVDLAIASQPNVNPDHSGRPSPVIMKVYELKSDLAFKQGDFITLFENPVQALGSELVAADELVLVPGEARTIEYKPNVDTKFVGLLLGFRQMERAQWRVIKPVDPEGKNKVWVELTDTSVVLVNDQVTTDWDPVKVIRTFQSRVAPQVSPVVQGGPATPQPAPGPGYVVPSAQRL